MTVFTSSKPTFNDDNCQKLVFSLAPALPMNFSLKVKNEFSAIELSYILRNGEKPSDRGQKSQLFFRLGTSAGLPGPRT